jgi:hypothetical protein
MASVFVVQFNGFMSLTSYFDVKYIYIHTIIIIIIIIIIMSTAGHLKVLKISSANYSESQNNVFGTRPAKTRNQEDSPSVNREF